MTAPESAPCGALTALHGDLLLGWAWNPGSPQARLAVEIMIDGVFVALVRADQPQPDPVVGDGFHGFAARVQPDWLSPGSVIRARVANLGPWLSGDITVPAPPALPVGVPPGALPAPSQVWYTGGLTVRGWAWTPEKPSHTVHVAVYEGTRCLARAPADRWHPQFAQHINPAHGFELQLPWALADGHTHTLQVVDDQGAVLTEGNLQVCVHPEGMSALVPRDDHHALLARLARDQDRRYPRSAGFTHYPQWHAQVGAPPAPATMPTGRVHVLLMGPGDTAAHERSLHSLQQQTLPGDQWRWSDLDAVLEGSAPLLTALRALAEDCTLIVPLQRGDTLAPGALAVLLDQLDQPGVAWGYADCDQLTPDGEHRNPWFKPAWDETLFYGMDLVTPGCALGVHAWLAGLDRLASTPCPPPVHWHSLLAAVIAATETGSGGAAEGESVRSRTVAVSAEVESVRSRTVAVSAEVEWAVKGVRHVPWVVYHRRATAPATPAQALPDPVRQAAIQWLLDTRCTTGQAELNPHPRYPGVFQVNWPLPAALPRVSLIVPTRDQLPLLKACLDGLLNATDYPNLEILVVDNDSRHPETLAYLEGLKPGSDHGLTKPWSDPGFNGVTVRVLHYPHPFNYAAINNWAAERATGSVLGLVNNDIEVLQSDWLRTLVSHLVRPGVGAVGAKLRWPNGMVQHGGVVVGVYDLAAHVGNSLLHSDPGYLGLNQVDRQYSAVTAACLLVHRPLYERLGGLREDRYPVTFNDVDFCLRLRELGAQIVWSAQAELIHAESASRGKEDTPAKHQRARREQGHFREDWARWNEQGDPFYHPALAADFAGGPYSGLALPPRPRESRTLLVTNTVYFE